MPAAHHNLSKYNIPCRNNPPRSFCRCPPAQKIDFPLSAVPEFNRPETSLQHFLTDPAIGQQLKIIIFFPDVFFIKCTAFCPLRRLMRKQKAKIKPDKRITDLICTGQHLLHQLQFHQILQIYTDLDGKIRYVHTYRSVFHVFRLPALPEWWHKLPSPAIPPTAILS